MIPKFPTALSVSGLLSLLYMMNDKPEWQNSYVIHVISFSMFQCVQAQDCPNPINSHQIPCFFPSFQPKKAPQLHHPAAEPSSRSWASRDQVLPLWWRVVAMEAVAEFELFRLVLSAMPFQKPQLNLLGYALIRSKTPEKTVDFKFTAAKNSQIDCTDPAWGSFWPNLPVKACEPRDKALEIYDNPV